MPRLSNSFSVGCDCMIIIERQIIEMRVDNLNGENNNEMTICYIDKRSSFFVPPQTKVL